MVKVFEGLVGEKKIYYIDKDGKPCDVLGVKSFRVAVSFPSRYLDLLAAGRLIISEVANMESLSIYASHPRDIPTNMLMSRNLHAEYFAIQDGTSNLFDSGLSLPILVREVMKKVILMFAGEKYKFLFGTHLRMDMADALYVYQGYPKIHEVTYFVEPNFLPQRDLSNHVVFVGQENLILKSKLPFEYFARKINSFSRIYGCDGVVPIYIPRYHDDRFSRFHDMIDCDVVKIDDNVEMFLQDLRPKMVASFTSTAIINHKLVDRDVCSIYIPLDDIAYKRFHKVNQQKIFETFQSLGIERVDL
jgi:hypothetical protein